jgi:hypothetical protein
VFFRADGARFREASAEVGLAGVRGVTQAVVADFDADAWLDLLCLGAAPSLLRNERGTFAAVALGGDWGERGAGVGSACDADGDGRIDVVLGAGALALARNRGPARGRWVSLTLTGSGCTPVGAVVRAHHADGTVQAFRAGSHHRGHLAQGFGVIPLATTAENPLRQIEVRFPGGASVSHAIEGPGALRLAQPER